jgi:wyosine [tRNA(Phe)-imidazoG37] synthetase (radical SAM superfamily)
MRYIFGPVFSRRLGFSLGVDLVPYKVCSMDCLYCEVGATTEKTAERAEYVPIEGVKSELSEFLKYKPEIDFITFSGYGEPTLFSRLGELVSWIKETFPDYKLALLTNSSLLYRDDVVEDVKNIDVILPSLDAGREETLKKLNRPAPGITLEKIVKGIKRVQKETKAGIWLETLFVKGINDSEEEVELLGKFVKEIKPDKWQLNTVVRPPAYNVKGLSYEELLNISRKVGYPKTEVVARSKAGRRKIPVSRLKEEVFELVSRRPCPVEEIADALNVTIKEIEVVVEELQKEGKVEEVIYGGEPYIKGLTG